MEENMKTKKLLLAFCTVLALACSIALSACTKPDEPNPSGGTEYTVTFDANGGTLMGDASVKVQEGNKIAGAPTAAKENHDFNGWFTQATGGEEIVLATYSVSADVTLYAQYTEKETPPSVTEYTVTFNANGGTLTGNAFVKVQEGNKITGAPTAAKENHDFNGWFTKATSGEKVELTTYTVSADVTLYAQYTEKVTPPPAKVEVTFDANGGAINGETKFEVDGKGNVSNLPVATREGYRFDAWYSAANGGNVVNPESDAIKESVTLYAHWIKTYTVTFDAGAGTLTGDATVTVDENGKITNAPTASKPGATLLGWYINIESATGGEKVDLASYTVTADVTLYARYATSGGTAVSMPVKPLTNTSGTRIGYRIEAEDAKITGEPSSENSAHPGEHTEDVETASGGHSIGFLGTVGKTITFTFNSATAGKAKLSVRATSNNTQFDMSAGFTMWVDNQTVTTADFTAAFNGAPVNFKPANLRGAGIDKPMTWNLYWDPIPLGELDVVAGVNTLVLTVAATTVPNMDCLDIETNLNITAVAGSSEPSQNYEKPVSVRYIVGGFAGGPAIDKIILGFEDEIPATGFNADTFGITLGGKVGGNQEDKVYLCDESGEMLPTGTASSRYVAIDYKVSFSSWGANNNLNPFSYSQQTGRNTWKDFNQTSLTIKDLTIGNKTYPKFAGKPTVTKEVPCLKGWDTTGSYTDGSITLKYASFAPEANAAKTGKKPLIVWLHGAGEGGVDPAITVLGNQVSNLSKDMIQKYFVTDTVAGAYVLAPQAPTMWMDNGNGQQGGSNVGESIYTESLFKLIKKYVEDHADIDANRVYVGGCSNGGWMTIEILSKHGEFFAAAFPIAVPFDRNAGLTDEEFARLVKVPMWITHAQADNTVKIFDVTQDWSTWPVITTTIGDAKNENSNSLYIELLKAGATNVHYSLFKDVTVKSGDDAATYDGHYSWVYVLRDECKTVQATKGANGAFGLSDFNAESTATVTVGNNTAATLWAWIAAQTKAK